LLAPIGLVVDAYAVALLCVEAQTSYGCSEIVESISCSGLVVFYLRNIDFKLVTREENEITKDSYPRYDQILREPTHDDRKTDAEKERGSRVPEAIISVLVSVYQSLEGPLLDPGSRTV
jgi:hypothetical protein